MRYRSNADYQSEARYLRDRNEKLAGLIVELCAALVRMDRHGYQQRLLARAYEVALITPERVAEFNDARAERLAARKAGQ